MKIIFKEKLVLILILMGLIPLLITNFFQINLFLSNLKEMTLNDLRNISEIKSIKVDNFIDQSLLSVEFISDNDVFESNEKSEKEKLEEINRINSYYKDFKDITILNENGELIVSSAKEPFQEWKENEWFLRAKNKKSMVISDIYKENSKIAFINPILNDNEEINHFIIVRVNAFSLFGLLDYNVQEKKGIILTNNQGDVLFSSKDLVPTKISLGNLLINVSEKGSGSSYLDFFNENQMAGFQIIENENLDFRWYLIAHQPEKEVFGIINDMIRSTLSFSLFFLAIIFAIALFLSRRISEPIKKLSLASKEISKGNLDTRLNIFSKDEFGELAKTFNGMIKKLKKNQEKMEEEKQVLEIKVQARTRELENMNKELEGKIQERTKEMKEKLKELEKMNKLMTGRELKMMELKKKLKKHEKEDSSE